MAFVVSEGQIQSMFRSSAPPAYSLRIADDYTSDYAQIWKQQASVRTCVTFLARNIASLGLHTFERVSDTDRVRLIDHPAASLMAKPSPSTTPFRLFSTLVHDLGIYDTAYWLKIKRSDGLLSLMRLNPRSVSAQGSNGLEPTLYRLRGERGFRDIPADQIVHFRGYSPDGEFGAPPIEALRQILAEEWEAGRMRSATLRNGARVSGYITRPPATPWSDGAREKFREGWKGQYTGGGHSLGGTPILEDGMKFTPAAQTAEQLQYVEVRKLTREEVAAAYFIPPPMIGLLDSATFSNITEQHKMLYQDTLGPWLSMIEQEIELQLLPDLASGKVYVEFNLAEKLKGSFEEQATAASTATGAPWMTRNEQRARANLPALEGGDDLVTPLNVIVGGQASPRDSAPKSVGKAIVKVGDVLTSDNAKAYVEGIIADQVAEAMGVKTQPSETYQTKVEEILSAYFARQRAVVLSALGAKAKAEWWDAERWNKELADDLQKVAHLVADHVGAETAERLGFSADGYDVARTQKFLRAVAEARAGAINSATLDQLEAAIDDPDGDPAKVFDDAESNRKAVAATTLVTTFAAFATTEAARQGAGGGAEKTWVVNSSHPRSSHAEMDGETVGIDDLFSNGMNWPGDPAGGADEVAGCTCTVEVSIS